MNSKKGLDFFLIIIAIITGSKLIKHTQFQPFKFEKPALDIIYLVAFVASIIVLVKDLVQRPQNK